MKHSFKRLTKIFTTTAVAVWCIGLFLAPQNSQAQTTAFSANWPLSTDLSATKTGNISAPNATYTAGTGQLFTGAVTYGAAGMTGTGISGKASSTCDALFNGVSAESITPYMEFSISPNIGNTMSVTSLTFSITTPNATTSGRTLAAGYSIDGGTTFTGFTPSGIAGGATAAAGPTGSVWSITAANTFNFSLPASVAIGNGGSLKIRIVIWRNNSSGSSTSLFTIGPVNIAGSTTVSNDPVAPTIGALTVPSPKVVGDAPFNLTNPSSTSSGSFSYTSSNTAVATVSGNTVTLVGAGTCTFTATQAAVSSGTPPYLSGSTVSNSLTVLAAPETPTPQTLPYSQNFGSAAATTLPAELVAWAPLTVPTSASAANTVQVYKANITSKVSALSTSLTPSATVYSYADSVTNRTNASAGFLLKSTNAPQVAMAINTIGKKDIKLSYDIVIEKAGNADIMVAQYRIGTSGSWTDISGSAPIGNNNATATAAAPDIQRFTNLALPASCNNQTVVQIRWVSWYANAVSCIFNLDNISISAGGDVVKLPTVSGITENAATLGGTIDLPATSGALAERGTIYATTSPVLVTDNPLAEGATTDGVYTQARTGFTPETQYYVAAYAKTGTTAYRSATETSFRTLSAPPTSATAANTATAISNSRIDLAWTAATFPGTGASVKGYLVLSALYPNVPSITNTAGVAPVVDANTTLQSTLSSTATSYSATGLNSFVRYNFVVVPFTWDGTNADTYNYFTTSLPTSNATTFAGPTSLSTAAITAIAHNTATSGGVSVNDGGGVITAKGVAWSTTANPTTSDTKLESGPGTNDFVSVLTGLSPQTLYNVRGYATNNAGTQYGANVAFRTLSSPVLTQASALTAAGNNTSATKIDFTWTAASFPSTGATVKGYVLVSALAPAVPTFTSTNGQAPAVAAGTTIVSATIASTATTFSSTTLPNNVNYNYKLIPFTWDGTNASTYNYLTANAPSAASTKLPIITAGGVLTFCGGGQVVLTSDASSGNAWYKDGVAISGQTGATLTATATGLYTVRVTSGSATATSVGIQITVVPAPVPNITSSEGTSISKGKSTQLTARDGVSYLWSPTFRIDNKTSANPIVQPDITTTYSVRVTNAAGCIANENITIEVINDYQISAKTLLTPNGDGKNDVWVIDNIDSYPDNEVKVFDQSGREVYRKKRYNNSWDGSYNGAFLPTGTYLYVIYFGDDKGLVKGYLTILK